MYYDSQVVSRNKIVNSKDWKLIDVNGFTKSSTYYDELNRIAVIFFNGCTNESVYNM